MRAALQMGVHEGEEARDDLERERSHLPTLDMCRLEYDFDSNILGLGEDMELLPKVRVNAFLILYGF